MPAPLRGQEQFDRVFRRGVPDPRHRERADAAKRQHRCVQQKFGQLRRESVTCRVAVERRDQGIEPGADLRLHRVFRDGAGNAVRVVGFRDQPFERGKALVAFLVDLACCFGHPAQQAHAFDVGGEYKPGAVAFGIKFEDRAETAKRAVEKFARLDQPAVFLPLAVTFLPLHPERPDFGAGKAVDAALGVGAFLDGETG